MKKLTNLISILIISFSCKAQKNLKEFYYPFSDKKETRVYKYVVKNDSTRNEYWKVTSIPKTKELKTISYDFDFNIYNTFYEIITDNGAELTAYSDFETNDNGKTKEIKAKVIQKNVYRWNGDKEYSYSVSYINKYGRFEFIKKRAESGIENTTVNGKEYKAVKFRDDYIISALDHNVEYRFYQDTFYVKDIGMIKYKREIPIQHQVIELELVEILTESEFEKIKANR